MADTPERDQRTEEATPKKREDARGKGQVAFSSDLTVGVSLLAGSAVLQYLGPSMAAPLANLFQDLLRVGRLDDLEPGTIVSLAVRTLDASGRVLALIVPATAVAAMLAGLTQTGFNVTVQPLSPSLDRLSITKGWQRIWSRRSGVRGLMAMVKAAILSAVAWWVLQDEWTSLPHPTSLSTCVAEGWRVSLSMANALALTLVAIGAIDFLFQRSEYESELRMTRQELKEEMKEQEGDPMIRARIKKLRRERMRKQMLRDVRKATVVITNPTHYAVALAYDGEQRGTPKVVAKGKDFLAARIREEAQRHDVPIVERPAVARFLYQHVEIGAEIPPSLYAAVIEIFNYLLRLRGRI